MPKLAKRNIIAVMQKRRSLIIIVALLGLVIAVFITGSLKAPENQQKTDFKDGEPVSLSGEMICLQHTQSDGPQTLECAYGFRDDNGISYQLQDTTPNYQYLSGTSINRPIRLQGIYRDTGDEKYLQAGTIEITAITE